MQNNHFEDPGNEPCFLICINIYVSLFLLGMLPSSNATGYSGYECKSGDPDSARDEQKFEAHEDSSFEVVIPRLELDISDDEKGFDHINKLFSVKNQQQEMKTSKVDKEPFNTKSGRNDRKEGNFSVYSKDIANKLESSCSTTINKPYENENENMSQKNTAHLCKDDMKKADRETLLSHLKFLDSFEDSNEGGYGKISKNYQSTSGKQRAGNDLRKDYFWKKKKKVDENEMLKVSLQSLDRYYHKLSMKISEADGLTKILNTEIKNSHALRKANEECEKEIAEMKEAVKEITTKKKEEYQNHQEIIHKMKIESDYKGKNLRKEIEMLKAENEELKRSKKTTSEAPKKTTQKSQKKKQLDKLMGELKENKDLHEKDVKKQLESLVQDIRDPEPVRAEEKHELRKLNQNNLSGITKRSENKEKLPNNPLKNKQLGDVNPSEKLLIMEQKNKEIIRNLREELSLKDKQLFEAKQKFENQLMMAQKFKKMLLENGGDSKKAKNDCNLCFHDTIKKNKAENERTYGVIIKDNSKLKRHETVKEDNSLEKSATKHQHFVGSMENDNFTSKTLTSDSIKKFAILKVEDIWEEQILCHENSIEKLKEMQNMREKLIKTRQQLERIMQENIDLKEIVKNNQKSRDNRWKEILTKQISEMQKKDNEIDDLKLELLRLKQEANKLSKQLKQSHFIQENKEKEIEILNGSVTSEYTRKNCIITMESMENIKNQITMLREENNYLLSHCDKMDEMMNRQKRELTMYRTKNNDLQEEKEALQDRCADLKSELNLKSCSLRELKEVVRELQFKNENGKDEIIDKKYELDLYNNKLKKAEQRSLSMGGLNSILENENARLKKKLVHRKSDLQNALDLIYKMKIRYKNVDEILNSKEDEIKRLSENLMGKENEIQSLNDVKKMNQIENKKLIEGLKQIESDKKNLEAIIEKGNETHKGEIENLEIKLANAKQELMNQENKTKNNENDLELLTEEVKQFKNSMETLMGVRDFDKIEEEIMKIKGEVNVLDKQNYELKNMKEKTESRTITFQHQIDTLKQRLKGKEEENNQIYDELIEKEKETENKDRLLNEVKVKLDEKSRYQLFYQKCSN